MLARVFTIVILALGCWQSASAQIIQGTITGSAMDASGSSVPGVLVIARNEQTGVTSRTSTTGVGVYSIPDLQAGTYTITADKAGFQRLAVHGLVLGSAQTIR